MSEVWGGVRAPQNTPRPVCQASCVLFHIGEGGEYHLQEVYRLLCDGIDQAPLVCDIHMCVYGKADAAGATGQCQLEVGEEGATAGES